MQWLGTLSAMAVASALTFTSAARCDEHLLVNVFPGPQHLAL